LTKTNPSEDIICPDASASTAIGVVKQQSSVEDILGMSNDQLATDRDSRHDSDVVKIELDKDLLKTHPPLDLCYDLAIDSFFYRVSYHIWQKLNLEILSIIFEIWVWYHIA